MNTPLNEILSSKENWTKYTLARNKDLKDVLIEDPTACSWCLTGALTKLNNCDAWDIVRERVAKTGCPSIIAFNDAVGTKWEDIKELIKGL